jgi:hypothetical protein
MKLVMDPSRRIRIFCCLNPAGPDQRCTGIGMLSEWYTHRQEFSVRVPLMDDPYGAFYFKTLCLLL